MRLARLSSLSLALALTLGMLAACSGDDEPQPTHTPSPAASPTSEATPSSTPRPLTPSATSAATPTPTATQGPGGGLAVGADQPGDDGFRIFVRRLDAGLQAQGAAAIRARWKTIEVVCRAEDVPQRRDGAFCDHAGEQYQGIESSSWRSSGGIAPVERVNARLDEASATLRFEVTDQYGDGAMRVYATSINGAVYRTVVTAVITSPADFGPQRPLRVVWLLTWEHSGGEWKATKIMFAYVLAGDLLDPTNEGRGVVPNWQRFP